MLVSSATTLVTLPSKKVALFLGISLWRVQKGHDASVHHWLVVGAILQYMVSAYFSCFLWSVNMPGTHCFAYTEIYDKHTEFRRVTFAIMRTYGDYLATASRFWVLIIITHA